ncbi:hypothetical protein KP509_21G000300 [Ceratopteris richardii]|uniref:non-specific serine/threonine protein kinase n=1 Tax=Ceratopteris richardii TaxID=49495 RepID=A0A8T2S9T0_CERRI|nr:hypothetical protein KP509_21G000300 [Ceratopteris richardii]
MADKLLVYRRRPKCIASGEDENENEIENSVARCTRSRKSRFSWVDRSLSSRNINKVKAEVCRESRYNPKQLASPNLHRKKRVEAPADFVLEQKNYFAEVDAFELEEESPSLKDRWLHNVHQGKADASSVRLHRKAILQSVQEDISEDLHNGYPKGNMTLNGDPLSQILRTPFSPKALRNIACKENLHTSEQRSEKYVDETRAVGAVHEISKSETHPDSKVDHEILATTAGSTPIIIISSDDEDEDQLQGNERSRSKESEMHAVIRETSSTPVIRQCNTQLYKNSTKHVHNTGLSTGKRTTRNIAESELSRTQNIELLSESKTSACSDLSLNNIDSSLVKGMKNLDLQDNFSSLETLLTKCGQSAPMQLDEAIVQLGDVINVQKLGEGTYGEAFRAGNLVFKIVPMGGDFLVNCEVQKTVGEMHTEMLLMLTLNRLRRQSSCDFKGQRNVCNNFIETKMVKVCQGLYGRTLINAWEEWNVKHESENDHPSVFPKNQLYMLFVLADGGKDLESFHIASFAVARSILTQVTAALAIAEEDCEFEHRDLHWGNILVARTNSPVSGCRLDGMDMQVDTCGVFVHIIDFTLSRLSTGNEILFSNLSDDPLLFDGPKGDTQAETYRKMLSLTDGSWDKRFSQTNAYWIAYLVDTLLTKKKFPCSDQESRALRALKKRLLCYESAKACLWDDFFEIKWNQ